MGNKTVTVLTVSKRIGWEADALKCIEAQTIKPKEWIIITECYKETYEVMPRWVKVLPAPQKVRLSNLNASLNKGLRLVTTDYVIFYQDFIELKEDCFEKLLELASEKTLVTTCTPNYDGSDDGRYTGMGGPRLCRPEEWEANVSIAPMRLIRQLGGFDEEYDNGWSWDNVNIAQRAAMLGCQFILDESNRPKLYPHEQGDKNSLPINLDRHNRTIKEIREGKRPLKNRYL